MVIPVIIAVLGTMSKEIHHYIKQIDILANIVSIQKTAILGTAYVLQRVLGIKKLGRFQMSSLTYPKGVTKTKKKKNIYIYNNVHKINNTNSISVIKKETNPREYPACQLGKLGCHFSTIPAPRKFKTLEPFLLKILQKSQLQLIELGRLDPNYKPLAKH